MSKAKTVKSTRAVALSIVADAAMKSAKTKSAKQVPANARPVPASMKVIETWDMDRVGAVADSIKAITAAADAKQALTAQIKWFRKNKITMGARRTTKRAGKTVILCALSQAFYDSFIARGITSATAATYLTALRISINEGKAFNLNPGRTKRAGAKGANKTTWKTSGEVLDALSKAVLAVRNAAGDALWDAAMDMSPYGFADALSEFLQAQADTDDEMSEAEANAVAA